MGEITKVQRLIKNGLVWYTNQNHEMTPHQQQLSTHQHTKHTQKHNHTFPLLG